MDRTQIKHVIEAALLGAGRPLPLDKLASLFTAKGSALDKETLLGALEDLASDYKDRGLELKEVASGYRIQIKSSMTDWLSPLWEERAPRYTRALLETLALIAYRQPITRAEIEEVRGVAVSTNITRTLLERNWIRVVGHRDVPGKPAMFGTTREFLDYFGLKKLEDLPTLAEIKDGSPEESPQSDLIEIISSLDTAGPASGSTSSGERSSDTGADKDSEPTDALGEQAGAEEAGLVIAAAAAASPEPFETGDALETDGELEDDAAEVEGWSDEAEDDEVGELEDDLDYDDEDEDEDEDDEVDELAEGSDELRALSEGFDDETETIAETELEVETETFAENELEVEPETVESGVEIDPETGVAERSGGEPQEAFVDELLAKTARSASSGEDGPFVAAGAGIDAADAADADGGDADGTDEDTVVELIRSESH